MVCKEEILTWFKDLDSYKRIDMLCELINMCIPFELRFVGSYIEEMGKHSYQELRQQALAANDVDKLDKDPSLKNQTLYEETIRHRMLINVSLLKSRNYNVANWYSKKFLRTDYVEDMIAKEKDDSVQNELLLLYTMAARHPAFSFEQKQFYNRILVQLYELRESRFNKTCTYRYPPGFEYPNVYRNMKVQDSTSFPMGFPMHPPGLPHHLDFMGHFRTAWPAMTCGAPAEVPPFSMQPPQPSTSPLVSSSPSQSRSGSPRPVSRPPAFTILTSAAPTVTIPAVNPTGAVAPGLPAAITTPAAALMTTPVASVLPAMVPVPIEALAPPPPPLGQSSQTSPVYGQVKPGQQENDELNTTLKDEQPSSKPPPVTINPWITPPNLGGGGGAEAKQINGLRIVSAFPPTVRTSIADQMQAISYTDESSHYHSSSSSSPLQTPPETPSNLAPPSSTSTPPHRTPLDKSRVNGVPNFLPNFGDTTSPPPQPAFTFPPYAQVPHPRFYTTAGFRPPVTTVFGQFAPAPSQPYHGGQPPAGGSAGESAAPSYPTYSIPYMSLMYSSFPPPPPQTAAPHNPPVPPRNQPPGCYNCGAAGHLGQDCPQHNIDDITQKNTYSVDFSPVNSDSEK